MVIVTMLITLSAQAAGNVTIDKDPDGQYQVKIGGRLFTVLHTQGFNKPILYPIIGPHEDDQWLLDDIEAQGAKAAATSPPGLCGTRPDRGR